MPICSIPMSSIIPLLYRLQCGPITVVNNIITPINVIWSILGEGLDRENDSKISLGLGTDSYRRALIGTAPHLNTELLLQSFNTEPFFPLLTLYLTNTELFCTRADIEPFPLFTRPIQSCTLLSCSAYPLPVQRKGGS